MLGIVGLVIFIVLLSGFMRMDANISKINETLQRIEQELTSTRKEKK